MAEEQMQNLTFSPEDLAGQERKAKRQDQAGAFASWLNSMSIRPDPNLPAQLQAARGERVENLRKNRTVNMLEQAGQTELANLVKAGTLDAKSAASQMFQLAAEERQFARQKELLQLTKGSDTTDLKNFNELKKTNPNLTFEEYMKGKNRKPLQSKGTYRYNNRVIGEVTFDPNTGEYFEYVNGQRSPIDISQARPITDATFAKAIPNYSDFVKLTDELREDRTSMDRLQNYMKTIGNTNEGFQRLGDQMTASLKTLLSGIAGDNWTTLSKEELSAAVAKGQLQGLIGRFRIETVGGGVMTEQDALRIIANLGGDVNALQNKEIVTQQIETLFRGKLKSFDGKRKRHDSAIDALYGGMGFDKVNEYEFDESVFNLKGEAKAGTPTMSDQELLTSVANKSGQELSNYLKTLSQADLNRLLELQE
jgi:hypothetical protein